MLVSGSITGTMSFSFEFLCCFWHCFLDPIVGGHYFVHFPSKIAHYLLNSSPSFSWVIISFIYWIRCKFSTKFCIQKWFLSNWHNIVCINISIGNISICLGPITDHWLCSSYYRWAPRWLCMHFLEKSRLGSFKHWF